MQITHQCSHTHTRLPAANEISHRAAGVGSSRRRAARNERLQAATLRRACVTLAQALSPEAATDNAIVHGRRGLLSSTLFAALLPLLPLPAPVRAVAELVDTTVKPELTPSQAEYDPTDEKLRDAASLLQQALNATDVKTEEELFTKVIETYESLDAKWVPDVVGRALGNRGNARSRQGKLDDAITDYNAAIKLCPWSVDPVLNRGVVLEAQGRFNEAVQDYRTVLAADPKDPSAWNNLGNASAGLQKWDDAAEYYGKAASLAPAFSFAAANKALATYQLGEQDPKHTDEALREMRTLLRRYPDFPDVRAALTAALWETGEGGEAESNWLRVDDPRYRDRAWLSATRRWPPRLVASLVAFLDVQSSPQTFSGSS